MTLVAGVSHVHPQEFLAVAREARAVLHTHAARVDADAAFPVESLAALRASGLMGMLVPARYGGMGGDLGTLVDVAQVLATGCLSSAMVWAMHCQQVDILVRHAPEALQESLLPALARGEIYLASITTEPGPGGHLLRNDAALIASGATCHIARQAPVVTGGEHADGFLITMRTAPDAPAHSVTLVYAGRQDLELEVTTGWDSLGMRGTRSVGLTITGAVPAGQIIGVPGAFRDIAMDSLIPAGHLGWAACWLGGAHGAVSDLVRLLRSPARPRSIDMSSDLLAERIARARLDVELASAYLNRVRDKVLQRRHARLSLEDPATQIQLNNLKLVASDLSFSAIDRVVQIVGLANGYLRQAELPFERVFRDLRSASLNYANDRLWVTNGRLALLDRAVRLEQASAPDREETPDS